MKKYMKEIKVELDENGMFDATQQIDFEPGGLCIEVVAVDASEYDEVKYTGVNFAEGSSSYHEGFAEADTLNVNGDKVMGYYVVDANNRAIGSKTFVLVSGLLSADDSTRLYKDNMANIKCGNCACKFNDSEEAGGLGNCLFVGEVTLVAFYEGEFGDQGCCKKCGEFLPRIEGLTCNQFEWKDENAGYYKKSINETKY